jgi:hypothetical protein
MKNDIYQNGVLVETIESSLDESKNAKLEFVREITSLAISSAGLDERTQLNAIAGIYSPERCEAIKSYIAACRNEYLRCKALILAATTNDEADAVQFVAPEVPAEL